MIELRLATAQVIVAILSDQRNDDWARDFPTDGDRVIAGLLRRRGPADPPWSQFHVVERETGLLVGGAGFMGEPDADGEVEIGYGIAPSRQGRGYATEAARRLARAALAAGARSVIADTDDDNPASRRVLEKSGFTAVPGAAAGRQRLRLTAPAAGPAV